MRIAIWGRALSNLVSNKQLPKYPFERGVDAFLGVFLPDIVGQLLQEDELTLVVQEFPLKKPENNQSTNIDYVLFSAGLSERPWVFLELKTDSSSLNRSQALIYAERLVHTPISQLLGDVVVIKGASGKGSKYGALLSRFEGYDPSGGVRVLYLTPEPTSVEELLPKGVSAELAADFSSIVTCATFSDLLALELPGYPHSWQLFRDQVISKVVVPGNGEEPLP